MAVYARAPRQQQRPAHSECFGEHLGVRGRLGAGSFHRMDAVLENPLGSDEAGDSADDGIEDLESVPLLGRRVSELEAQLAKHEVVLGSAGGFGQSAIRAVLAHLGKSPANWYASVHHSSAQPSTAAPDTAFWLPGQAPSGGVSPHQPSRY